MSDRPDTPEQPSTSPGIRSFLLRNKAECVLTGGAGLNALISAGDFALGNPWGGLYFAGIGAAMGYLGRMQRRIRKGQVNPDNSATLPEYLKAEGLPRGTKHLRKVTVACGAVAMGTFMTGYMTVVGGILASNDMTLGTKIFDAGFVPAIAAITASVLGQRLQRKAAARSL